MAKTDSITYDLVVHGTIAQIDDLVARIDTHMGYPKVRTKTWTDERQEFYLKDQFFIVINSDIYDNVLTGSEQSRTVSNYIYEVL